LFGPTATRRPSMESMKACTRCGDALNILGHTLFSSCLSMSAQLKPHTPSAMCLMAAQAVCLWTRSLKHNQTQQPQYDTQLCTYSKFWNCKCSGTLLLNCDTLKSFSSLVTSYHNGLPQLYGWIQLITALFTASPYTIYLYPYPTECSIRVLLSSY